MVALSPCVHAESWVAAAAEGEAEEEEEGAGAAEGKRGAREETTVTLGLMTVDGLKELAAHFPKFAQSFFSFVTRHLVTRMANAQVRECVSRNPYFSCTDHCCRRVRGDEPQALSRGSVCEPSPNPEIPSALLRWGFGFAQVGRVKQKTLVCGTPLWRLALAGLQWSSAAAVNPLAAEAAQTDAPLADDDTTTADADAAQRPSSSDSQPEAPLSAMMRMKGRGPQLLAAGEHCEYR